MVAVLLVVADATDHALLDALGLQADDVEHLADVASALRALGITKLLVRHTSRERFIISAHQHISNIFHKIRNVLPYSHSGPNL